MNVSGNGSNHEEYDTRGQPDGVPETSPRRDAGEAKTGESGEEEVDRGEGLGAAREGATSGQTVRVDYVMIMSQ